MQDQNQHSLQNGTILNHYKIIRVLGAGGFGITYLAEDVSLGMEVVIKEYFPNEFAVRKNDSTIIAKTSSENDFSKGKQRFREEAKVLAKFNHPSIVKILGYFEANNTAYFIMEYEEGIDLSQYLKQNEKPLSQKKILSIIMPILEGLKEVHQYSYLHRDIKPGNILLRKNKSPILIDFGASKLALGDVSKSITSMLTEGYAPLEQYSTDVKQQGSFTDLYAMAAVIYKMITGEVPPSAQTRSYQMLQDDSDPFVPLTTLHLSEYDTNFLKAVDRALSMKAKDRPQNVQEFQADIAGELKLEKKTEKSVEVSKNNNSGVIITIIIVGILLGAGYFYTEQKNNSSSAQITRPEATAVTVDNDNKEPEKAGKELDGLKQKQQEAEKKRVAEEEQRRQEEYLNSERQKQETEAKRLKKDQEDRAKIQREEEQEQQKKLKEAREEQLIKNKQKQKRAERKKKFPLTIKTTPSGAKVQILKIKPKYYAGILLDKGKYKVRVSKKGHKSVDIVVDPSKSTVYRVTLERKSNSTSNKVSNCKVKMYSNGSISAVVNGKWKLWVNMTSRERARCANALKKARGRKSRVKSHSNSSCKVKMYSNGSISAVINGKWKLWVNMNSWEKSQCANALKKARARR